MSLVLPAFRGGFGLAIVALGTVSAETLQLERSSGLDDWTRWGPWIWGDGRTHRVTTGLAGERDFFRSVSHPIADLGPLLTTWRNTSGVPAVAAVVIQDGEVAAVGAVGNRRFNTVGAVTLQDRWHHGSITKSMTATLAAIMVEEELVTWETTVGEVFPGKVSSMANGWSAVTLKQLLANSGGAPGDLNSSGIWTELWNFHGLPRAARELLVDEVTARALRYTPGSGYEYSSAGFAIAGAMLETVADTPWEDLMQEKLFRPLGMISAGFGVPATPRHLDHPVGHSGNVLAPTIWDPGISADNPPAIGPAGTVHASILDMARYVQFHLRGARGDTAQFLPPALFSELHSRAFGNNYALGWNVITRPWAGGDALQHTGSNTQWFTNIWIAPEVNWACVVCINFGSVDNTAFGYTDQVVGQLLAEYAP